MASGDVRCTTPTAYGRRQALLTSRASTVGDDLQVVKQDQLIKSDPSDYKRRRTIAIQRAHGGSCGFTLQSYGLHHKTRRQTELLTYVDYVEHSGPAHLAGLRPGDVILSINGVSMEKADHNTLVSFIRNSGNLLRMVVLFDDCCHKIELRFRQIKLQQVLAEKIQHLKELEVQESLIMKGLSARYNDNEVDDCASSSDDSSVWSSRCSSPHVFDSESSLQSPDGSSTSPFCSLDSRACGLDSTDTVQQSPRHGLSNRPHYFGSPLSPVSYDYSSLPTNVRLKKQSRILQTTLARAAVGLMSTPRSTSALDKMSHSMDEANMKKQQVGSSSPEAATVAGTLQRTSRSLSEISERRGLTGGDEERRRGAAGVRGRSSLVGLSHAMNSFQRQRRQRRVAKHVVTPDCRQPQLVSLRQFCDDYRTCCLQQNLTTRRRSLDRMLSTDDVVTTDDDHVILLEAHVCRDSSNDASLPAFTIQPLSNVDEEQSCSSSSALVGSTGQVDMSPPMSIVVVTDSDLPRKDNCPAVTKPSDDDEPATLAAEASDNVSERLGDDAALEDSIGSCTTMTSFISTTTTEDEGATNPPRYNCSAERIDSPVSSELKQDLDLQLTGCGTSASHDRSLDTHDQALRQTAHNAVERISYNPQTGSVTIEQDDDVSSTAGERRQILLQSSTYADEWNLKTSANDVISTTSTDKPMSFSHTRELTGNSSSNDETCPEPETTFAEPPPPQQADIVQPETGTTAVPTETRHDSLLNCKDEETWL